ARPASPSSPSASLPPSNFGRVVGAYTPVAATASELGQQEASGSAVQGASGATGSFCAEHHQMAAAHEVVPAAVLPAGRTTCEAAQPDPGATLQPGLDRRLQRMVTHGRRSTGRTADGPRHVQLLSFDSPRFGRSKLACRATGLCGSFSSERLSRGDP